MLGMCWESCGTAGRSSAAMRCFGMRHFAPWWMTVVCLGLASFGASSRVSGGTGPVTGGTGLGLEPVGCFHVLASQQSVLPCPCRLSEVLAEEAVLRPLGKL